MMRKAGKLWAMAGVLCAGAVCLAAMAEDPTVKAYAPYPQPDRGYVTDIANLLTAEQEQRLEDWLYACEEENGFEMAVVTIFSIKDYAGTSNGSVEAFARGLFNAYGIGNMPQNNGVLLLVAITDREVRIELGAHYGTSGVADTDRIMQNTIVPEFRNGRYDQGVMNGTAAILQTFGGKEVGQTPAAQTAAPVQTTAPARTGLPVQTVHYGPVGRSGAPGTMFWLVGTGIVMIVLLGVVSMVVRGVGGAGRRPAAPRSNGDSPAGHTAGLLGGLFGGNDMVFGGRSSHGHRHTGLLGGGSSHGGIGSGHSIGGFGGGFGGGHSGGGHSSGFGGGHSRGGGASGKW